MRTFYRNYRDQIDLVPGLGDLHPFPEAGRAESPRQTIAIFKELDAINLKSCRAARFRCFLAQYFWQKAARPYKCEGCIDAHRPEKKCQSETAVKHDLLCLFADHDAP